MEQLTVPQRLECPSAGRSYRQRSWRPRCDYYSAPPKERWAMTDNTLEQISEPAIEHRIGRSVSLDHAAEMLGVSRRTIYNRIREGRLLTIRTLGGSQRVLVDSMQADSYEARDEKAPHLMQGRAAV